MSAGILPQKIFKFGGYEMLFSALVMRYVSEKSTSHKCGKQVFSVLASAYFRGPVNLKYTLYPSTSTLNISQYCMMFGSLTFCLYTICTHHGPTNFSAMKMANNKLQVTTIKMTESKENKSIHRLDLPGSTGLGGGQLPPCPPPASYASADNFEVFSDY